jgi:segregation and condensation protein B
MDDAELVRVLEALIFVSRQPVTDRALARAAHVKVAEVRRVLVGMRETYASRGIVLEDVAGGLQFRTASECAEPVQRLLKAKPIRLSRAALETLAIIAYRQPCTRAQVDEIRGVESGGVVKFLMDRSFIKIIGKKEEPGRPFLYATTGFFLEFFGLGTLKDLPPLKEVLDLEGEDMPAEYLEAMEEPVPEPSLEEEVQEFLEKDGVGDDREDDGDDGADEEGEDGQ